MKVRDVIDKLQQDGWTLSTQRGSHRQFDHPIKLGKVTVAGHPSDEVPPGTLGSIRRQSGIPDLR